MNETIRKPTVMGHPLQGATVALAQAPVPSMLVNEQSPQQNLAMVPVSKSSQLQLDPELNARAEAEVEKLDFATLPTGSVVQLGYDAERALHGTLDQFLARIDKKSSAKLFELFERVKKKVDDAKLDELLKQVMDKEPGFLKRIFSKGSREEIARKLYEETMDLIGARSKTLADELAAIERELNAELKKLFNELGALEQIKQGYRGHLSNFAVAAAVTSKLLDRAKAYVESERQRVATLNDPAANSRFRDLEGKLQNLESRALSLEGQYTRIPADEEVVRQIQNAGVSTLQETMNTASQRLANIKVTLLALHGAMTVRGVQMLGEQHKRMDEQLSHMRQTLTKQIVTTAANAPGDNRIAQAKQIESIIAETKELGDIIAAARIENERKFDEARASFIESRKELSELSQSA